MIKFWRFGEGHTPFLGLPPINKLDTLIEVSQNFLLPPFEKRGEDTNYGTVSGPLFVTFSYIYVVKLKNETVVTPRPTFYRKQGAFLALVSHTSSYGVTIKIPNEVDVLLHWPALHSMFSHGVG